MTTTARRLAIPRNLTLLASLALASSVILASAGATLAAKPVPSVDVSGGRCTASGAGLQDVRYYATADLSGNKGRWIYVSAELAVGSDLWQSPTQRLETTYETVEFKVPGPMAPATLTVTLVDRNGESLDVEDTSDTFCG